MSEDLARLFAETAAPSGGEAFAAGVAKRIARRRWLRTASFFVLIAALLSAAWATSPAIETWAPAAAHDIALAGNGISSFFKSPVGITAAGALLLPLAVWAWATGRLRSYFG